MISRRRFNHLAAVGLAMAGLGSRTSLVRAQVQDYKPVLKEDGQYTQSWFLQSFLDLREDLEVAHAEGKRLAIVWEQLGCPYCREMHLVNFAIPEIRNYVEPRFAILQLDIWGSREVVNFSGQAMTEKELARLSGVRFTPTIQFFAETLKDVPGKDGTGRMEVARMPGYFQPFHFLTMFEFVAGKAYESSDFLRYLQARADDLAKEGKKAPSW